MRRVLARSAGLTTNRACMTDLEHEIATVSSAYVRAAVTDIAVLRRRLWARRSADAAASRR